MAGVSPPHVKCSLQAPSNINGDKVSHQSSSFILFEAPYSENDQETVTYCTLCDQNIMLCQVCCEYCICLLETVSFCYQAYECELFSFFLVFLLIFPVFLLVLNANTNILDCRFFLVAQISLFCLCFGASNPLAIGFAEYLSLLRKFYNGVTCPGCIYEQLCYLLFSFDRKCNTCDFLALNGLSL